MDLERRDLRALANAAFNRYLEVTGDYGGLAALPLFLACRAWTRAHTMAAAASAQKDQAAQAGMLSEARGALDLAAALLAPPPARLVAIGGLSGTGKSTVARQIAPELGAAPGAVVLRSDVLRKRLSGVAEGERLGPEGYTADMSTKVYASMISTAEAIARAGQAAIADAVFARPDERAAVRAAARAPAPASRGSGSPAIWACWKRGLRRAAMMPPMPLSTSCASRPNMIWAGSTGPRSMPAARRMRH